MVCILCGLKTASWMRFSAGSTKVFIRWSSTSVMNGCDIRIPEGVRIRIRLFGHYGLIVRDFRHGITFRPSDALHGSNPSASARQWTLALASPCKHQGLRTPSKGKLTPYIVHNRRASSVTSGIHALLGTSRNPDKAVNLGAVSGVYQDQSSLGFSIHHDRAFL